MVQQSIMAFMERRTVGTVILPEWEAQVWYTCVAAREGSALDADGGSSQRSSVMSRVMDCHNEARTFWLRARARSIYLRAHLGQVPVRDMNTPKRHV